MKTKTEAAKVADNQASPSRHDLLADAKKLFGMDVCNATLSVAHFCEHDNATQARLSLKLLRERMERASEAFSAAFPDEAH